MQTQKTFEQAEALVSYVEQEIREVPTGSRLAWVSGPATEAVTRTLMRKGYCVQASNSTPRQGLDLVVVMNADETFAPAVAESAVLSLNHEGRLIVAEAEPSQRQERRLRAHGFLVRIKRLGPVDLDDELSGTVAAASPSALHIYDAHLVRRRQSLR